MRRCFALLALALLAAAPAARAQRDSAQVTAGARYRASGLRRWLLGSSYRELWTAPLRVPVLDLAGTAGGLTPTGVGGGNQTRSLRLSGADGRQFSFRSVDKEQTRTLPADYQNTLVSRLVQDQTSSLVPAAGVAAHAIEAAAGLPHTREQLLLMPDDPRLGQYRAAFAGMLGTLEERPLLGGPRLPGLERAERVADSDSMLAALAADPAQRVDARAYLTARLVDLLLGDWDRHEGQYEWARAPSAAGAVWTVVPRDRDYAFVDYDGVALSLAGIPNAVRFSDRIAVLPLLLNATRLDRRLLGGLSRGEWEAVTRDLLARLDDAALEAAIAALPAEFRARDGARLGATLRARRDGLAAASAQFYAILAREPEAHGSDRADQARVERLSSGNLRVTLSTPGAAAPYYQRELNWLESREVRVYLHGGDDQARVVGEGPEQVIVRLIGGPGDDTLVDEGRSGHRTAFYDFEGDNHFQERPRTRVDSAEWHDAHWVPGGGKLPPRDWGLSASTLGFSAGWRSAGVGPVLLLGPSWTRYGFRRAPYAARQRLQLVAAPEHARFGVEYEGDFRSVGRPGQHTELRAHAGGAQAARFYGFGNDSDPGGLPRAHFRFWEQQLFAGAEAWRPLGAAWLSLGASAELTDPEAESGTPAGDLGARGSQDFYLAGAHLGVLLEHTDSSEVHRSGWTLQGRAQGYPLAGHDASAFGGAQGVATSYLSAGRGGPTLALRAGGEKLWGGFPLQYGAMLGGGHSLRGYASERFVGDAAAFGNAELRQRLGRTKLVVRGELGVFALADAGRVWYQGASPGGWHSAFGGGVFFAFLDRTRVMSLSVAHGEDTNLNFAFHLPY